MAEVCNHGNVIDEYRIPVQHGNTVFVTEVSTEKAKKDDVVLLVCHGGPGLSDHTETFSGMKTALHQCFWGGNRVGVVVFYDQLGCGKSDKPNIETHDYSLRGYVIELRQVIMATRSKYPESPICVLGHSWGGQILLELLLSCDKSDCPISCAIVSNSALDMKSYELKQQQLRAALDEDTRKFYEQDEENTAMEGSLGFLIYQKIIGKSDTKITGTMKGWEAISRVGALKHPCLFVSGDLDNIPLEEYHELGKISNDNEKCLVKVRILEGGDHGPFFGNTAKAYFSEVSEFLSSNCGRIL